VVRVVDGDTIVVGVAGRQERVRLIGIDTPESVKPGTPIECFGKEASGHLASLLPEGTAVRLVGDVEPRDRYGRLLAYVYREPDGLFVNAVMARDGFAEPLTIPPNVAHSGELAAAAHSARDSRRGLWAACSSASGAFPSTRGPPRA
jgi:micrococcal nuclease